MSGVHGEDYKGDERGMTTFAVITEVPKNDEGNHAVSEMVICPEADKHVVGANIIVDPSEFDDKLFIEALRFQDSGNHTIDLTKKQMIFCQTPVFRLGEILVIDSNDRTIRMVGNHANGMSGASILKI